MENNKLILAKLAIGLGSLACFMCLKRTVPDERRLRRFLPGAAAFWILSRLGLFFLLYGILGFAVASDVPGCYYPAAKMGLEGKIPYRDFTSSYGPVFPYIAAAAIAVWDSPKAIVLLSIAFEAIAILLWYRAATRTLSVRDSRTGLLLYLCNPVPILNIAVAGQNQIWLSCFLAAAFGLLLIKREFFSGFLLGLSVAGVKILSMMFLPYYFLTSQRKLLFGGGIVLALTLGFLPFYWLGADLLQPLKQEGDLITSGNIPYLLGLAGLNSSEHTTGLLLNLFLLASIAALSFLLYKYGSQENWPKISLPGLTSILLIFLLLSKKSYTNYLNLAMLPLCCSVAVALHRRLQHELFLLWCCLAALEPSLWFRWLAQGSLGKIPRQAALRGVGGLAPALFVAVELILLGGYVVLLWIILRRLILCLNSRGGSLGMNFAPGDVAGNDAQPRVPPISAFPPASSAAGGAVPLCVDLDDTLIRTDCAWESAVQMISRHPLQLVGLLLGGWRGKAWLKGEITPMAPLAVESLPYNADVLDLIKREKTHGRRVLLVTATDQRTADAIAAHLRLFDEVIGSNGVTNLKGSAKAALLVQKFGRGGFDYAGDSAADIRVWAEARCAYAVNPVPAARRWLSERGSATILGTPKHPWRALARALRPQHWVKNALVFLPVFAAHLWGQGQTWLRLAGFFVALCFGASAVYLVNDLVDVESDRRHKDKCRRPVAAGDLRIRDAVLAIPLCLGVGLGFCWMSGWKAMELMLIYFAASNAYSLYFKKIPVLDVIFLSGIYVYRVVAGGFLAQVEVSDWLKAFAMFLFLSLAAAKRYVELTDLSEDRQPNAARGYLPIDYPMIAVFGVNCGCLAVLVLGLYVNSQNFQKLYSNAAIFWLLCPLLLYWLIRVWLLAGRRKMREDPVVFAMKDPVTWIVAAIGGLIVLLAMSGSLG